MRLDQLPSRGSRVGAVGGQREQFVAKNVAKDRAQRDHERSLRPRVASRTSSPMSSPTGEVHRDRGLPGTVESVTTVLVTAMVLVAVMFVVVVATLALAARAHRRRQLDDARAEARHWVERLGGELLVLDGAAARPETVTAAGLAEAAERFTAAGAELAAARTPRQCRIAQDTAVEGLHHVRTARRSLRLDPGPRVPGQGVGAVLRTALGDGAWSIPRLVDDVLAQAQGRARQLPAATMEPAEWIRRGQQRWMRPEAIRRR